MFAFYQVVVQGSVGIPAYRLSGTFCIGTALGQVFFRSKISVVRRFELLRTGRALCQRHLSVDTEIVHNGIFDREVVYNTEIV